MRAPTSLLLLLVGSFPAVAIALEVAGEGQSQPPVPITPLPVPISEGEGRPLTPDEAKQKLEALSPADIERATTTIRDLLANPRHVPALAVASEPGPLTTDAALNFGTQSLVLGVQINDTPIEAFVLAEAVDNRIYVGLASLTEAVDFPVTVSPADKSAAGWFIRESQTIQLGNGQASVNGITNELTEGENILYRSDDLYVAEGLIGKWFGMSFSVNGREMTLNVKTSRPLPFEEKILRERRLALLQQQQPDDMGLLETLTFPYRWANMPYVDVTSLSTYDTRSDNQMTSSYSVLAKGDLARHTAEFFVAGDFALRSLAEARLNLSRKDETGQLLGPLGATSYSLGDVDSQSLTLVSSSSQGRGITLSSRALYRSEQFDTTTFRGSATPGWDVELYRNDALIGFTAVGANSQYEFLDVPLFFGRNLFRIVLYGPQGQVQEETRELYAGSTLLEVGDMTYNFSVSENDASLFALSDNPGRTAGLRGVGELEFGLTKWLTASVGAASLGQEDGDHQYFTTGLRVGQGPWLASLDLAHDIGDGLTAARLASSTTLWGMDLRGQHTHYGGFVSDENRNLTSLLTSSTSFDLSTDLYVLSRSPLNVGLGVEKKIYEDGDDDTLLRARLSRQVEGISLTQSFEKGLGNNDYLRARTALRGSRWRVLFGLNTDYSLSPTRELERLALSAQFRPFTGTSNRTEWLMNGNSDYELRNTLTADFKKYSLSLYTGATSERDYFMGVGLNFSFTRFPLSKKWHFQSQSMADSGGAVMRAYLDRNSDELYNEGEELVEDVNFRRDNSPISTRLDKTETYATGLIPNRPTRIRVDRALSDPTLSPAVDVYEIIPREGYTAILDFPFFESAQLDGTAQTPAAQPLIRAKIELVSADGEEVRATETEFDGYYLFENIRPGNYTVRIASPGNAIATGRSITLGAGQFETIDLIQSPQKAKENEE